MKVSIALSALLLVVPLLVDARPSSPDLVARQRQRQTGKGGAARGAAKGQAKGGNNGAAAAKAAAAAAAAKKAAGAKGGANNAAAGGAAAAAGGGGGAAAAAAASSASAAAAAATAAAATGQAQNVGGNAAGLQTSLTLDPSQVAKGLANDGQQPPVAGQVPSLTTTNNFINFCATVPQLPLTNGQQVIDGSCNGVPMGVIVAKSLIPRSKFVNPANLGTVKANTAFTMQMAIENLQTGSFTNAAATYYAAPAQVNGQGVLIGHSHVVIQQMQSVTQTTTLDPNTFAFFKGLNDPAANGQLSTAVTAGVPVGQYRMCSINSASNHQPALVAVAQHGGIDDCVYFEATADGTPSGALGTGQAAAGGAAAAAGGAAAAGAANNATAAAGAANAGQGKAGAAAGNAAGAAAAGAAAAKGGANNAKGGAAAAAGAAAAKGGAAAAKGGAAAAAAKGSAAAAKGGAAAAKGGAAAKGAAKKANGRGRGRGRAGRGRGRN